MSIAYHTHLVLEVHLGSSLGVMILHHTIYSNVLLASGQDALSCPANKAAKVHTYFLSSKRSKTSKEWRTFGQDFESRGARVYLMSVACRML